MGHHRCPTCGAELPAEAAFCLRCGAPVAAVRASELADSADDAKRYLDASEQIRRLPESGAPDSRLG